MKLQFCGAAGTVTGSSHLLTLDDGYQILLDCGLYQGRDKDFDDFNSSWYFDPAKVDLVLLSHAHIDHSGRLPKLVKDGFKGGIFATHATRDLCAIMLMDSAHIQEKDAEYMNKRKGRSDIGKVKPLYDANDVKNTLSKFIGVGYSEWQNIHEDVDFVYNDAGHILGSASVTLRIRRQGLKDTYLGFSGDIGRPDRPILRDPVPLPPCDHIICESTYGDKLHKAAPGEEKRLLEIITETCVKNRGKLIIPAFSVGRTQEIVHMIDKLETKGVLPNIPVYVDSPLSTNATDIFILHPDCFDKETMEYMRTDPNPFGFNNLKYTRSVEESKKINNVNACVVISSSGMANAGRIRHHLYNGIEDPNNTVLIVGYCAEHTLGAQLARGNKQIRMFGQDIEVKARIEKMNSFSAHGDQKEMIDFLRLQNKKKIRNLWLVHGDPERQAAFQTKLEEEGFDNIHIPELGWYYEI